MTKTQPVLVPRPVRGTHVIPSLGRDTRESDGDTPGHTQTHPDTMHVEKTLLPGTLEAAAGMPLQLPATSVAWCQSLCPSQVLGPYLGILPQSLLL